MDEEDRSRYQIFLKKRKLLGLPDPFMDADVYSDSDLEEDDDDWIQVSSLHIFLFDLSFFVYAL